MNFCWEQIDVTVRGVKNQYGRLKPCKLFNCVTKYLWTSSISKCCRVFILLLNFCHIRTKLIRAAVYTPLSYRRIDAIGGSFFSNIQTIVCRKPEIVIVNLAPINIFNIKIFITPRTKSCNKQIQSNKL